MVKRRLHKNKCSNEAANKRRQRANKRHQLECTEGGTSTSLNTHQFQYIIDKQYASEKYELTEICQFCNARLFVQESTKFCCGGGNIQLESLPPLPAYLSELLHNSTEFLAHIRKYNNAFAMTSLGCSENWDYLTFKISGKMYHRIGALIPAPQDSPQFLQLYFLGNTDSEAEKRQQNTDSQLDLNVVTQLQHMMHSINAYVILFKSAFEKAEQIDENVQVVVRDSKIPSIHKGRTNAPTTDEVAIVITGNAYCHRDIIVQCKFYNSNCIPLS